MNKLRVILAAALLATPGMLLNASTIDEPAGAELRPLQQQAGCCWVVIMGRWYCMPCS